MPTLYCRLCSIFNFCCEKFAQVTSHLPRACMEHATTMKQLLDSKFILFTSTLLWTRSWMRVILEQLVPVSISAEHEHWIDLCELVLRDMHKEPVPGELPVPQLKGLVQRFTKPIHTVPFAWCFPDLVSLEEPPRTLSVAHWLLPSDLKDRSSSSSFFWWLYVLNVFSFSNW